MWAEIWQHVARARVAVLGTLALVGGLSLSTCAVDDRQVGVASVRPQPAAPQCLAAGCPADDACRTYSNLTASAGPDAGCVTLADCSPVWKPAAREGAACRCDDSGCLLRRGEPCSKSSACDGSSCWATADGGNICCAAVCSENEVCSADGSSCVPAAPCTEDERRCSGSLHQRCVAGAWQTLSDCADLGCSAELDGCRRSAGQACESDADCGQGTCLASADGNRVCCTGSCNASCQRCSALGTECVDIADDEACGSIACPADPCRLYDPATVLTNRCNAGQCATPEQACTVFQLQRAGLECSAAALCDEQGNCARPKNELLAACSSNEQCATGACVAAPGGTSVCCSRLCAASELCGPTGACQPAPTCSAGSVQCSGSNFQRCVDGQWTTELACGALGCSLPRQGCFASAGQACATDADCGEGSCQATAGGASICCTAACNGPCRLCGASGTACTNLPDDAACGIITCPADTTCRDFPPSVTSQRCVAGSCGGQQLCQGNARSVGQACSASNLCDSAGNCSLPKKGNGQACAVGSECTSNSCVDGVCCNGACAGQCQTCAVTGICRNADTDPTCGVVSCSGFDADCVSNRTDTSSACVGGRCRAASDCGFASSTARCGAGGLCDGQGRCQGPSVRCGNATCSGNDVCCAMFDINTNALTQACGTGSNCPTPGNFVGPIVQISCDQNADCTGSEVCCIVTTNVNSGEISCRQTCTAEAVGAELGAPPEMLVVGQVCGSPAGQIFLQCPAGTSCVAAASTLPAAYMMCR